VCYSIAVPTSSANAGSGNIYFQIKAPTSFEWVALGTGTGMTGANIFVMYQDGKGNVTLSPRLGQGHFMPMLDTSSTAAHLTLLAGSGVSDDSTTMTANVACSNCQSWSGGSMSLKSTSAGWIGAWKQGSSLATTNRAATINQHDDTAEFRVDLTRATISSDSNPFPASRDNTGGGSGSGSGSGNGNGSGGGNGNSGGSGNGTGSGSGSGSGPTSGGDPGGGAIETASGPSTTILVAHGVIMAIVMAALYPLGALLMPLVRKWWLHAAWQAVAFCLMWAGFGLGVVTAKQGDMVSWGFGLAGSTRRRTRPLTSTQLFNQAHTICGTVVVCLLAIQPGLGVLHHLHYQKTHRHGLISHAHIWWGRLLMVLGVINGGLGLQLAGASDGPIIAYSVVAGIIFVGYAGFKIRGFSQHGGASSVGTHTKEARTPPVPRQQLGAALA
jgi:hypothetical protein